MQKLISKENQGSAYLQQPDNTQQFPELAKIHLKEGVTLSPTEESYLLPHFLLLVIGKPGSGKTTLVKHMLLDKEFYKGKFDKVLMVSPSIQKTGLPYEQDDVTTDFNLTWIYTKLDKMNDFQLNRLYKIYEETYRQESGTMNEGPNGPYFSSQSHNKQNAMSSKMGLMRSSEQATNFLTSSLDVAVAKSQALSNQMDRMNQIPALRHSLQIKESQGLLKEARLHQLYSKHLNKIENSKNNSAIFDRFSNNKNQSLKKVIQLQKKQLEGKLQSISGRQLKQFEGEFFSNFIKKASEIEALFQQFTSTEQRQKNQLNVLLVLDDCIGSIKQLQNDQYLAQLFFNRRHLVANGTVSIMLLSQKYTMIPSRIRSSTSWVITFRLNPVDFENMFQDVFTGSKQQWQILLKHVFGDEEENLIELSKQRKGKTFDNLGIFVEKDIYFKNFAQIIFQSNIQ